MRVLIFTLAYRNEYALSSGTISDAVSWAQYWTDRDPTLHVYLVVPDRDDVAWDTEFLVDAASGDYPQITIIEARRPEDTLGIRGFSDDELAAVETEWDEHGGYFDVVIDQRRKGRDRLVQFLTTLMQTKRCQKRPFRVVDYVHDVYAPYMFGYNQDFPFELHGRQEFYGMTYSDRIWFSAESNERDVAKYGSRHLPQATVKDIFDRSRIVHTPLDISMSDAQFSASPRYLHIAGDAGVEKRNPDVVLEVSNFLYGRFDIETILTTRKSELPPIFKDVDHIHVHKSCPYETYRRQIGRGDIVLCVSKNDTEARTMFEQAAGGQVLLCWNRPWLYDQLPTDYALTIDHKDDMKKLAYWAVSNWDEAVAETKRGMEVVETRRGKENVGNRTYDDMRMLVDEKLAEFSLDGYVGTEIVEKAADSISEGEFTIETLNDRTQYFTDSGATLLDIYFESRMNLVDALRRLGYVDTGERTPRFRKAGKQV